MEYIIGFWMSLVTILFINRFRDIHNMRNSFINSRGISHSQSHIHTLIRPMLPKNIRKHKNVATQSMKHYNKTNIKIIILDDIAYWIKDNNLFSAQMQDGAVNQDSTSIVDTIAMDKVQLGKVMFIVDKLREGLYDDSGSSGN
jgi:hypothetical protein